MPGPHKHLKVRARWDRGPAEKWNQRHILIDRRHGTTACLVCRAMRTSEIVYGEEKIFCTGLTRAAKATRSTNQPRKDPFHLSSLSPYTPHSSQQVPTLSSLSDWNPTGWELISVRDLSIIVPEWLSQRRNWVPHHLPASECVSPLGLKVGGGNTLAGECRWGSQLWRLDRKPGTLFLQRYFYWLALTEAQFISLWPRGIKSTLAYGCGTGPPANVAGGAGKSTLCQSRLYPPLSSETMHRASVNASQ